MMAKGPVSRGAEPPGYRRRQILDASSTAPGKEIRGLEAGIHRGAAIRRGVREDPAPTIEE